MLSPCPCINCITFSICKAQATEHMKDCYSNTHIKKVYGSIVYIDILKPKCSLIKDWIDRSLNNHKCYIAIYKLYKTKIKG